MKKIISLLLWIPFTLNAQHLITTAGAEGEGVIWSIGETITSTLSDESSNLFLTQGFLQPDQFEFSGVIFSQSESSKVKAYPNPVKDKLFIETDNQPFTWTLRDSLGKILDTGKSTSNNNGYIDTDRYVSGYYILTVTTEKGSISTKVIK